MHLVQASGALGMVCSARAAKRHVARQDILLVAVGTHFSVALAPGAYVENGVVLSSLPLRA